MMQTYIILYAFLFLNYSGNINGWNDRKAIYKPYLIGTRLTHTYITHETQAHTLPQTF